MEKRLADKLYPAEDGYQSLHPLITHVRSLPFLIAWFSEDRLLSSWNERMETLIDHCVKVLLHLEDVHRYQGY